MERINIILGNVIYTQVLWKKEGVKRNKEEENEKSRHNVDISKQKSLQKIVARLARLLLHFRLA